MPEGSFNPDDDFATQAQSIDRAMMSTSQHCVTHGGHCTLLKPVDFDVSGLPCEENSRANCKRKYLQGRFGSLYLVWSKYHRTMRTPMMILETPQNLVNVGTEFSFSMQCLTFTYVKLMLPKFTSG